MVARKFLDAMVTTTHMAWTAAAASSTRSAKTMKLLDAMVR
jgi:hypothetical protein